MLIWMALFAVEKLQVVQDNAITPFTAGLATVSVGIVQFFDDDAQAEGRVIRSTENGFAVSIEAGCNGVEALIILFAALFAFPAALKYKIWGFVVGFFAIQILNLVRIISLFYLGQWSMTAFEWFHLYLWQALLVLDALVVWLIWLRKMPENRDDQDTPPPTPA